MFLVKSECFDFVLTSKKRRSQAILFSFQIEMTTKNFGWHLVFESPADPMKRTLAKHARLC